VSDSGRTVTSRSTRRRRIRAPCRRGPGRRDAAPSRSDVQAPQLINSAARNDHPWPSARSVATTTSWRSRGAGRGRGGPRLRQHRVRRPEDRLALCQLPVPQSRPGRRTNTSSSPSRTGPAASPPAVHCALEQLAPDMPRGTKCLQEGEHDGVRAADRPPDPLTGHQHVRGAEPQSRSDAKVTWPLPGA
jgi:hypothetical protein